MKHRILFLLVCCLFFACSDSKEDPTPVPEENKADITILAYLVANNNLDSDILANIGAMYDGLAAIEEVATLLVYWDGKTSVGDNRSTHAILKYQTDGKGNINGIPVLDENYLLDDVLDVAEVVKEYPEQLSTDKKVMTQVLKDMRSLISTPKVGLIAGSHASAWTNSIYLTSRSRSFGQDGSGTDNTMLITDMADAIKDSGITLDFLLFDACYMGTIEVCDAFQKVANYQIVSPLEIIAYGFPYEYAMKDLYEGTVEGYTRICETYINYYQELYQSGQVAWGTITLVDSKEIISLTQLLKEQISQHADLLADYSVAHLQEYGKRNGKYISFDLMQFVKDLNEGVLPELFQTQLDKTILYKGCLEYANPSYFNVDKANYCGLGMYIPNPATPKWNAYYKTTDWYSLLGWNQVSFNW